MNQVAVYLWLTGNNELASSKNGCTVWARRYLLDEANNSCEKCGWGELHPVDRLPLVEVDHIDGDHTNNRRGNLQVLCPNHHSMTPFHRNRNKGNGRGYRRLPEGG